MPLKTTGNFAKLITALLVAASCSAAPENNPGCPQEAGFKKYSEINFENSSVCISVSDKNAKLTIAGTPPNKENIENNSLIEVSEIKEGIVHLEKDNQRANLYFEYPNNTYLITIITTNNKLASSSLSIKTAPLEDSFAESSLILETKDEVIKSANLENINKNDLFRKENLKISTKTQLKITSPKAYLWDSADDTSAKKMYLIEGDKVIATEYKNGRLRIQYTTSKGRNIEKWTNISSIL